MTKGIPGRRFGVMACPSRRAWSAIGRSGIVGQPQVDLSHAIDVQLGQADRCVRMLRVALGRSLQLPAAVRCMRSIGCDGSVSRHSNSPAFRNWQRCATTCHPRSKIDSLSEANVVESVWNRAGRSLARISPCAVRREAHGLAMCRSTRRPSRRYRQDKSDARPDLSVAHETSVPVTLSTASSGNA